MSAFNYISRHAVRWSSILEDLSIADMNGISPVDDTMEALLMLENIAKKDTYRLLVQEEGQPGLETNGDYLEFITTRIMAGEAGSLAMQKQPSTPPSIFPLNYQLHLHSQASPVQRYSSLFNSHFITFTGKGHQIMSLPESAEAMRCFAKEAIAMATALETAMRGGSGESDDENKSMKMVEEVEETEETEEVEERKKVASPRKRRCVTHSPDSMKRDLHTERKEVEKEGNESCGDESVFPSIYQTIRQYEQVLHEWETSTDEQVRNELRGQLESLKTAIIEAIASDGSRHYIANSQGMFNPEKAFGVMHDAFSNLLIYLHNTVPVVNGHSGHSGHSSNGGEEKEEGQTLLDQYFVMVVAAVRLYYIYAIQTACVVINMIALREQKGE